MDNILSTKFLGAVLVIVLAYVLVFVGKLSANDWLGMSVAAMGIYSGANVIQKFTK